MPPVASSHSPRKMPLPFATSADHCAHASDVCRVGNGPRRCLEGVSHQGDGHFAGNCSNPSRRRLSARKVWLPNWTKKKMVLGDILGLEEAASLALNALIGRFSYRRHCTTPLYNWVKTHWFPILGYVPTVFYLSWGCFGFTFNNLDDAANILEGLWPYDEGSIMLKR
jgi:hypothetical protein